MGTRRTSVQCLAAACLWAAAAAQAAPAKLATPVRSSDELPSSGHGQTSPWDYNIWGAPQDIKTNGQGNCHNAADAFLMSAMKKGFKAGILLCGGAKPQADPAWHSANWILKGEVACLVNWGDKCCWHKASLKYDALYIDPAIAKSLACVKEVCGTGPDGQYSAAGTRTLPAGRFVERPGPYVCSLEAAGGRSDLPLGDELNQTSWTPERKGACLTCCKQRAGLWQPGPGDDKKKWERRRKDFYDRCTPFCRNFNKEYGSCRP